jgi:hypothetical protein
MAQQIRYFGKWAALLGALVVVAVLLVPTPEPVHAPTSPSPSQENDVDGPESCAGSCATVGCTINPVGAFEGRARPCPRLQQLRTCVHPGLHPPPETLDALVVPDAGPPQAPSSPPHAWRRTPPAGEGTGWRYRPILVAKAETARATPLIVRPGLDASATDRGSARREA